MKLSRSTNNFNEKSGCEFRGKSDISCYVQSNASHPWAWAWNTVDAHVTFTATRNYCQREEAKRSARCFADGAAGVLISAEKITYWWILIKLFM